MPSFLVLLCLCFVGSVFANLESCDKKGSVPTFEIKSFTLPEDAKDPGKAKIGGNIILHRDLNEDDVMELHIHKKIVFGKSIPIPCGWANCKQTMKGWLTFAPETICGVLQGLGLPCEAHIPAKEYVYEQGMEMKKENFPWAMRAMLQVSCPDFSMNY